MTSGTDRSFLRLLLVIVIIGALLAVGMFLNLPDRRTPGERAEDAADELSEGIEDTGEALEKRTPGERLKDTIEDATEPDNQ